MSKLSSETISLLKKTRDYIVAHPWSYSQHIGFVGGGIDCPRCIVARLIRMKIGEDAESVDCNSVLYQKATGLTGKQFNRLYNKSNWPSQFNTREENISFITPLPTLEEEAKNAAARIDHFLATDGEE